MPQLLDRSVLDELREYARARVRVRADARLARGAVRVREAARSSGASAWSPCRTSRAPSADANEAYVPRFVWADGLTMQQDLDPSDADFFVPGRVDAYRYEARHRSDAYPLRNTEGDASESFFVNWFAFTAPS